MSKREKGPLDVAIRAIHFYIAEEPGLDRDRANRAKSKLQRLSNLEAAIRVLEAAGKIKNPNATFCGFETICDIAKVHRQNQFAEEIRNILRVLPDDKEKP